jgi:hypothetical protein
VIASVDGRSSGSSRIVDRSGPSRIVDRSGPSRIVDRSLQSHGSSAPGRASRLDEPGRDVAAPALIPI